MRIATQREGRLAAVLQALAFLAIPVALLVPVVLRDDGGSVTVRPPSGSPPVTAEPTPGGDLAVDLAPDELRALEAEAASYVRSGVVDIDSDVMRPAVVRFDGRALPAHVRLKGDKLDHVDSDRLSLRIELDSGAWRGMRTFSIQHPKTRGYLREWLVHRAARHEGVLAPRSDFVEVSISGRPPAVYFYEEHFEVPLLESQGRREGPIVRLDEDTFWKYVGGYGATLSFLPTTLREALLPFSATASGFDQSRLQSDPALAPLLDAALSSLERLAPLIEERWRSRADPAASARARLAVGDEIERLLDVDAFARFDAIASVFRAHHALAWHNRRYYYDPVTSRLEPILFDADVGADPVRFDPVGLTDDPTQTFPMVDVCRLSDDYRVAVARSHARLVDPHWLADFSEEVGVELERRAALLERTDGLAPVDAPAALWNALELERIRLSGIVHPPTCAAAEARLVVNDEGASLAAVLRLEFWGTTTVPVRFARLRAQNGAVVEPARALLRDGEVPLDRWVDSVDGRTTIEFDVDPRMVNLSSVRELIRRVSSGEDAANAGSLDFELEYDVATEDVPRRLQVVGRAVRSAETPRAPVPPTLDAFLAAHPFVTASFDARRLVLAPGVHRVDEDLVLPEGFALTNEPTAGPVVLEFAERACLVAFGPLDLVGVELRGRDGGAFEGLQVLDAKVESRLVDVVVRGAGPVERGGWRTTGGVTFYRSPLVATRCRFESAPGEDALNVFGVAVELRDCVFQGVASDAFDGDFVHGSARGCVFRDVTADGVDTSGSEFLVADCTFERIGDKCVSAGEASTVTVANLAAQDCRLGIVAKDRSVVTVEGARFDRVGLAALAAFEKKPEYGPASMDARSVVFGEGIAERALVQIGSTVVLEGVEQTARELDVEEIYRGF
ncbi:MAG: hypothetical protein R3F34_18505 [Planctomycetota bacterium]